MLVILNERTIALARRAKSFGAGACWPVTHAPILHSDTGAIVNPGVAVDPSGMIFPSPLKATGFSSNRSSGTIAKKLFFRHERLLRSACLEPEKGHSKWQMERSPLDWNIALVASGFAVRNSQFTRQSIKVSCLQ